VAGGRSGYTGQDCSRKMRVEEESDKRSAPCEVRFCTLNELQPKRQALWTCLSAQRAPARRTMGRASKPLLAGCSGRSRRGKARRAHSSGGGGVLEGPVGQLRDACETCQAKVGGWVVATGDRRSLDRAAVTGDPSEGCLPIRRVPWTAAGRSSLTRGGIGGTWTSRATVEKVDDRELSSLWPLVWLL
jgi:hypothetical protein